VAAAVAQIDGAPSLSGLKKPPPPLLPIHSASGNQSPSSAQPFVGPGTGDGEGSSQKRPPPPLPKADDVQRYRERAQVAARLAMECDGDPSEAYEEGKRAAEA
jgi:hypothetical protein